LAPGKAAQAAAGRATTSASVATRSRERVATFYG
jgi:hypothetical protein